jgi:hypothetical protein
MIRTRIRRRDQTEPKIQVQASYLSRLSLATLARMSLPTLYM